MSSRQASLVSLVLPCNAEVTLGEESLIKHKELWEKIELCLQSIMCYFRRPGVWASTVFDIKGERAWFSFDLGILI